MDIGCVLVVDDEPGIRKLLTRQLQMAGFRVLVAADGEEALTVASAQRPDAIVLDLMMPKRSGLDACASLRQNENTREVPIVLFSGKQEDDVLTRFRQDADLLRKWGANAFVSKEEGSQALIAKINQLLGRVPQNRKDA